MKRFVIALALAATACSKTPTAPSQPPTPLTVSLRSDAWTTFSDPEPYPLSNEGSNLVFNFPVSGSINYIFTPSTLAAIRGTVVVTLQVSTTGPVLFNSLDPVTSSCVIPPSVRPFFWSNSNGNNQYDRWWSHDRFYALANGTTTISVPLEPQNWSSVNGRIGNADSEAKFNFDRALLNVTRLGLTFGGGCSYGHGINIQGGTAKFALSEYAVK